MATYNLRRFSHAAGLKEIGIEHLLALLNPHNEYFKSRGLNLPSPSASDGLDYDQLVSVLMNPASETPENLLDALFFVHEMSTPEGMDLLLQEAASNGISIDGNPSPADVAVQVYLRNANTPSNTSRSQDHLNISKPKCILFLSSDNLPAKN